MIRRARRVGRFSIPIDLIDTDQPESTHGAAEAAAIMACCIIVRAEMDYASQRINYAAICPQFFEISEGAIVPVYTWEFERDPYLGQLTARVSGRHGPRE